MSVATYHESDNPKKRRRRAGAVRSIASAPGSPECAIIPTAGMYGHDLPVNGIVPTTDKYVGYESLATEIAKFFKTGQVPLTPAETLEIFALIQAAEESKAFSVTPSASRR